MFEGHQQVDDLIESGVRRWFDRSNIKIDAQVLLKVHQITFAYRLPTYGRFRNKKRVIEMKIPLLTQK